MRYLGNKTSILQHIESLLKDKNLLKSELTFFDAFCGSGSVADYFKQYYKIIINDNLTWSVVYTYGRVCANSCSFKKLGFNPFEYLNSTPTIMQGFIYNNYSPGNSERMYFTAENAGRIDFFRWQIEQWKTDEQINENEYCYLLACLIESVSDVSNTAGVYGAFLKKWDSRALKKIIFDKVDSTNSDCFEVRTYNNSIESIIADVDCDILYLDPPYTQNQYGTQYHLLETLILNDNPSISKVTGSRPTAPMRSDWSKDIKAHILFDKIVASTKARYILFSYNNDGFMSKEYIESTLKRYGVADSYICKKIHYKKYQNWKSCNRKEHFEYLFFIEKKTEDEVVYESPLNYIGSKAKIVPAIKSSLNNEFKTFVDAFGGGFNVGINVNSAKVIYNDFNYFVKDLIQSFSKYDTYDYIMFIKKNIKNYGLRKADSESYKKIRDYYNSLPKEKRDPRLLYTIILYGYQQQIRFNGSHEFNNPVGMRWFNDKLLSKMISFCRKIKEGTYQFESKSYLELENVLDANTFIYLDPPYMMTTGTYNDGKRGFNGWNQYLEKELFEFCDRLTQKNVHFMLSYVIEHKGSLNKSLLNWIEKNEYTVIRLGDIIGISGSRRKEVLIVNYDI